MFVQAEDATTGITRQEQSASDADLADLPLELIERRLTELASQIYAGTCRWLEYVAEFDRREGWGDSGCLSCADWIAWRCAVSPRAAREHVRIARRLSELPAIHEAFKRGELSYSKLRPLTRVASSESEADLLELARHATAAQLERMLRAYRRVTTDEADVVNERAYLGYSWEEDGSLAVRARLAPEQGAAFLRALEASRDAIWEQGRDEGNGSAEPQSLPNLGESAGSAEPRVGQPSAVADRQPSPPITNVEAFAGLIEVARTRGPTSTSGGERYLVNVHVDASVLTHNADGRCELDDGPALSPETARKLVCDSSIVRILESEGKVLSVGRRTRSIPPAIRRALLARDGKCRFPGCERRSFLDAHHLEHWAHGGETSLDNLAALCRAHHDLCHEGRFTIEGDPNDGLIFRSPYGWALEESPPLGPTSPSELKNGNDAAGLDIGPESCAPGSGEKMDLPLCVDAVVAACADP